MAALNFPANPSVNDTYSANGSTWTWNGISWLAENGPASGYSGISGYSGYSGQDGITGESGTSGWSGFSGFSGDSGYSGFSGESGYSGFSGESGYSGSLPTWLYKSSNYTASNNDRIIADTSGGSFTITLPAAASTGDYVVLTDANDWSVNNLTVARNGLTIEGFTDDLLITLKGVTVELIYSGSSWQVTATIGTSGVSGFSGDSGISGFSGQSGFSGATGESGISGFSGSGISGFSGSGISGFSGSGISGFSGESGISGFSGSVGATGATGTSGFSGSVGATGTSGFSGASGISGFSGSVGATGTSGFSGFSGVQGDFPAGTVMLFAQTAAPTGWTKNTSTGNNNAIRVVTGTASSGGTVDFTTAFTSQGVSGSVSSSPSFGAATAGGTVSLSGGSVGATTLSTAEMPSHTHGTEGFAGVGVALSGAPNINQVNGNITTGSTGGGGSHTHSFSGQSASFSGTSHTHSISVSSSFSGNSINLAVRYIDVIRATKD